MKVLCRLPKKNWKFLTEVIKSFARGIRSCGEDVSESEVRLQYPIYGINDCDVLVVWSMKHRKCIKPAIDAGKDILICEHGYIGDRQEWISTGWNDINGKAEFTIGDKPRWKKIWSEDILKPWNMDYDHALIIGQVTKDASLRDCKDIKAWYKEMTNDCLAMGLPVIFRRHPEDKRLSKNYCPKGATLDCSESINKAMENALVVTYSSNVGVLAVLAGHPVIAWNQTSMIYNLAAKSLEDVKSFDREPWLHRMAYCQWHVDELEDGSAWRHLRTRWLDNPIEKVSSVQ